MPGFNFQFVSVSDQQIIIFQGRELKDAHCLSDYGIQHGSIVQVSLTQEKGYLRKVTKNGVWNGRAV